MHYLSADETFLVHGVSMLGTEQNPFCEGLGALRVVFRLVLESRLQYLWKFWFCALALRRFLEKVLDNLNRVDYPR